MHRPVVFAVGMFIVGLVSNYNISIFAICSCCSILYSFYIFSSRSAYLQIFTSLIFISLFVFGMEYGKQICEKSQTETLVEQLNKSESGSYLESSASYQVTGRVEVITETEKGFKIKLLIQNIGIGESSFNLSKKEYMVLYCDDLKIEYGNIIKFSCNPQFYNSAYNEGGFDSKSYYLARNITGYTYPNNIEIIDASKKMSIGKFLNTFKSRMIEGIKRIFSDEDEGILIAMLTGERSYMEDDVKLLYQETGFAHILAISGLHISIIGMSLFAFMRKKEMSHTVATVFTLLVLCVYNSFSGGQVSCRRAIIMLCISLIAKCIGQKYDSLTALAVAAMVILFNRPHYIYDSSFIMSFSAGLGTSIFGGIVNKCELYMEKKNKKYAKAFLFSASIQAALLPSQVEFFNKICPYSIILNLILLPFVPLLIVSGFLSGLLCDFSFMTAYVTALPAKTIIFVYNKTLLFTVKLPASSLVTGHMTLGKWLVVIFVIISFGCISSYYRKVHVFLVLLPLLLTLVPFHSRNVKIAQLYVGQGDCCIITFGDTAIAIDGGSSDEKEVYNYFIKPYLLYNGYDSLDYVFLSHADNDHVSGIRDALAQNTNSETRILIPNLKDSSSFFEALELSYESVKISEEDRKGFNVSMLEITNGTVVNIDELKFTCIYPDEENNISSENDTSMVLYMNYGSFSMLFMGDLSDKREGEVLANIEKAKLNSKVNILKVGHHGSKSSSEQIFLEKVKPEFAFISCGVNNSYGHPSDEVIERLKACNSRTLITAENGQITVVTDGNRTYFVSTFFN